MRRTMCIFFILLLVISTACERTPAGSDSVVLGAPYSLTVNSHESELRLYEGNRFELLIAEDDGVITVRELNEDYGISASEPVIITQYFLLSGTYKITDAGTVIAESEEVKAKMGTSGSSAADWIEATKKELNDSLENGEISDVYYSAMCDILNGKAAAADIVSDDYIPKKYIYEFGLNSSDMTGNVHNIEEYNSDNNLERKEEYKYSDVSGKLMSRSCYQYENGIYKYSEKTEYNENGSISKIMSYDSEHRLVHSHEYWPDIEGKHGGQILKNSYNYDEYGNIIDGGEYDKNENIIKIYSPEVIKEYACDENGYFTSAKLFDKNGNIISEALIFDSYHFTFRQEYPIYWNISAGNDMNYKIDFNGTYADGTKLPSYIKSCGLIASFTPDKNVNVKYNIYNLEGDFMAATLSDMLIGLLGKGHYNIEFNSIFTDSEERTQRASFSWSEEIEDTYESLFSTSITYNTNNFNRVSYTFTDGGQNWNGIMFITLSGQGGFYLITFEAEENAWEAHYDQMEQMLCGFYKIER